MTVEVIIRETRWYVALQDGPADDRTYATRSEAEAVVGRGECAMSRTTDYTLHKWLEKCGQTSTVDLREVLRVSALHG